MTKKINWKTEKRKVKDLIPAGYNPRKISDKAKQDLMESIKEFSEVDPLVINTNNHLIGGHQRLGIYKEQAIEEVDVRIPNRELTREEEMRLNLRLNKNVAEWDIDKLQEMDIETLLDIGFGDEELSTMFDNVDITDDNFNLEQAIEEVKTTTVKLGDLYEMEGHRLMCGDSTKEEEVAKLMGNDKANIIYCDPPYNIGLSYSNAYSRTEGMKKKYYGTYNDKEKNDSQYSDFIFKTIENAKKHAEPNAHYFYWCDEKYIGLIQSIYEKLKIANKRVCLWIKNGGNPVPHIAFNKAYEACVYGTTGKPFLNKNYTAFNEIMNKEVEGGNQMHDDIFDLLNIWLVKRDTRQEYEHPIQKPLDLCEKPLKRCSAPGTIVMDLFGGSGSTMMSCDQMNRRAFLMELDPIFCQVIINRWEDKTGQKAKKLN